MKACNGIKVQRLILAAKDCNKFLMQLTQVSDVQNGSQVFLLLLTVFLCGVFHGICEPNCFFARNRYMVSLSDRVIAVYDGRESGGTLFTMRYAHALKKEVRVIQL